MRSIFYNILCTKYHKEREQMLQIWLLYNFYFLVSAYIVAKPYISTYGLATIYAHTRK